MKTKLTKEEKEILDSFEKGERVSVTNLSKRKKELVQYAHNTLNKDKRLNIRISERDLLELQRKAVKNRITISDTCFKYHSQVHKRFSGRDKLTDQKNGG